MNNPTYYAILTSDVRYCPDLSPQEKLLFAEITALTNKDGECFAANNYFAKLYGLTDTTISHQVSNLEKNGFIKIEYEKEGAKVKKRIITIAKKSNGEGVLLAKNRNRTVAKNRKENNTSILTLQDINNICEQAKSLSLYFVECLKKNNPKIDRSEQQKIEFAETFERMGKTYSWNELKAIIRFATSNDFWKSICLSAKKIEQHAEKLFMQSARNKNPMLVVDQVQDNNVDF